MEGSSIILGVWGPFDNKAERQTIHWEEALPKRIEVTLGEI